MEVPLTPSAIDLLREAKAEAELCNHTQVQPGHIILGLFQIEGGAVPEVFLKFGIGSQLRDEIVIAMNLQAEK